MAKIAFYDTSSWEQEYLKKALKRHKLVFSKAKLTPKTAKLARDCDVVSVFIHSKVNGAVLKLLPRLKLIATRSTGYDHIDIEECKKRNVLVCNVPTYGENTVAEHTFALILALSRKLPESAERTKHGNFDRKGLEGFDLKGKTIGIIGTGNIGAHVARIANGFEMNILAFDIKPEKELVRKYKVKYKPYEFILKNSDIITYHVPLNPHTKHMLNKKNINLLKKGSYVINTARGGIIDTSALLYGLKRKILAGVAIDVLENESFITEESVLLSESYLKSQAGEWKLILQEHILAENPKVIITPHNAFNSKEAVMRILDTTVENIKCFESKICVNRIR